MRGYAILTVMLMAAVPAMGAMSFSTNFGDGFDAFLDGSPDFTHTAVTVGENHFGNSVGWNDLIVVAKTKESDYVSNDWVATVSFTTNDISAYMPISVGLGDPTTAWSWQPNAPSLYATAGKSYLNVDFSVCAYDGASRTTFSSVAGETPRGGVMVVTKAGDSITFEVTRTSTGSVHSSGPLSISTVAPFLNDTNSKFFVAVADNDVWISSIDMVVPEPATMSLVLLGGVCGLVRRR